jgi:hypothetical protein
MIDDNLKMNNKNILITISPKCSLLFYDYILKDLEAEFLLQSYYDSLVRLVPEYKNCEGGDNFVELYRSFLNIRHCFFYL